MVKVHKEQRRRVEKESRDRRHHDQEDQEPEHENFSLQRFQDKRKFVRKVEGFGMNSNVASYDDKGVSSQAFVFCEKVKEKLGNSDDYQAFLKCLNIFNNGIIRRNDLQNLVTDLIGKYPDLMEELNDFLDRCERDEGFLAVVMSKKSGGDGHVSRSIKMEDKEKEHKREFDVAKEKERYREKYTAKSIQELDLSDCQRCTPSYRLLPNDYPIPSASQRSDLGARVLNDHWVSVTSGSEDYSFKHMRRNQYEESLFRCEDDRFELDILLESVSSTAKHTEDLLNSINENKIEMPIHIEEHFTALNLRCIERLYGDHGLDVMDILRKNPTVALPVILTRLKQKQEEWTRCRSDFNKVWAEIYAKNHYKSLDHRSFYFKQQDSKNLSTRLLVAEIKELKDKKQKEDDILLAFAAGNRQPVVPHMEYEYSDFNIHEDLYKLVQYSCKEVCSTKEQLNKVMRLWTTFVEPMLGVFHRLSGTENPEDDGKSRCPATHCSASSIAENGGSQDVDPNIFNSKHPRSAGNGDENNVPELASLCKISVANGDSSTKESGLVGLDRSCKDDPPSCTLAPEREQKDIDSSDRMSGLSRHVASLQVVSDSRASPMIGEHSHGGSSTGAMSGSGPSPSKPASSGTEDHKLLAGIDASFPSEVGVTAKSVLVANGAPMDVSKANKYYEVSSGPSKIEKEEGELSPNGDFEENLVVYGDTDVEAIPEGKHSIESKHNDTVNGEELHCQDAEGENDADADADADDEDSENASEAGDEASGSESGGDECSREEHEDDEDVDQDEVDGKAESEGEAEGTADTMFAGGDVPLSERFLMSVKPLAKHVPLAPRDEERKDCRIFYGNDDFYVLFRLHQVLYERIFSAKTNSTSAEMRWRTSKDADSLDPYARFMAALYNLLDGSVDNAKFEDECRAIIGNQSYVLFTLDKLIYKLVKQLQTVATDEMDHKLLHLHEYEKSRKVGKFVDSVYHANARFLLHEENIYRLEFSSSPSQLCIQLMDNAVDKPEVLQVSMDPNFAAYLHNDYLSVFSGKKEPHDIILRRNKRRYVGLDEFSAVCMAMEGIQMFNGLECKIACNSCKISYVLDTEDYFFRPKKKNGTSSQRCHEQAQARVERFQMFLSAS
uniref:Paired amphipathic helix protein Sin3-like 2 n=1 Tax=Rhizophora mucronata TaxID=61149 RepID=A0A2P2MR97_RHIMU